MRQPGEGDTGANRTGQLAGAIVYVCEIVRFLSAAVSWVGSAARTYSTFVFAGDTVTRRCPELGRITPVVYSPSRELPVEKFPVPGCGHSW